MGTRIPLSKKADHVHLSVITPPPGDPSGCRRCPRLVDWRERVAREKVRRYAGEEYWGNPVPGFGDLRARLLLVGLAPAAHGANRTGRMFTGDRSGDWLYGALFRAGFANQPDALHRDDGLTLTDCYITAAVRCAPPANKPTLEEMRTCSRYLAADVATLTRVRVIIGLGRIGFHAALGVYRDAGLITWTRRPVFGHGAAWHSGERTFIASFHPSQQNTFTGRLTRGMFDAVFRKAVTALRGLPE